MLGTLSGGNQQKVLLGRWLERHSRVLLLIEPTRGVDVGARQEIYRSVRQLAAEGVAVLVATSDYEEVVQLADRAVVMARGRVVAELDGRRGHDRATDRGGWRLTMADPKEQEPPIPAAGTEADAQQIVSMGGSRLRVPEVGALVVFLLALCIFFSIKSEFFLGYDNFLNILTAAAIVGIIACPATMLLVAGQFDLSVGSALTFCGIVMAYTADGHSLALGVLATIAAGIGIGIVNGFLVNVIGINALITTLGTLAVFSGLAKVIAEGQTLPLDGFDTLGTSRPIFDIPLPVIIFAAVVVLFFLIMRYTVYGRSMYAIGSNPTAARLSGIRTRTADLHRVRDVRSGRGPRSADQRLAAERGLDPVRRGRRALRGDRRHPRRREPRRRSRHGHRHRARPAHHRRAQQRADPAERRHVLAGGRAWHAARAGRVVRPAAHPPLQGLSD